MPYADLIHDVRVLVGGSPARKTPDYYASLSKQYADDSLTHSKDAEAAALESAESSKASENALKESMDIRDECREYYEYVRQVAESIKGT